jgi:hypothetical protein
LLLLPPSLLSTEHREKEMGERNRESERERERDRTQGEREIAVGELERESRD